MVDDLFISLNYEQTATSDTNSLALNFKIYDKYIKNSRLFIFEGFLHYLHSKTFSNIFAYGLSFPHKTSFSYALKNLFCFIFN